MEPKNVDDLLENYMELSKELPIMTFFSGPIIAKCLYAVTKLGVAKNIGESITSQKSCFEVAKELNAHGESLYRVMRALATEGIFEEVQGEHGVFKQTKLSLQLLNPVVHDDVLLHLGTTFYLTFNSILDTVLTGQSCGPKSLGTNTMWEFLKKNPEEDIQFTNGMKSLSTPVVQHLVKMVNFNQYETVCDVGGSHGLLLETILKFFPNIKKGLNFDQPIVFENFKKLGERQRDPRYEDVAGSFFESVPEADCYIFKWVLHNWNDDQCVKILENVSKSIKPNGKIYLAEHMCEDFGNNYSLKNRYIIMMDLHMMNTLNGKVRTRSEWNTLISRTQFKIDNIITSDIGLTQNFIVLSKK